MMRPATIRHAKTSEEGYILLLVMFMLALMIIAMAVALPKVAADIQRDRELETMHRGKQYRRAIQLYYRKMGSYPPNMDALVKTNEIRFLRKKYIDPTTGKNEWKPILFGQNKTPMAMGFFGQPLGGFTSSNNALAGTGTGGGNGVTGASSVSGTSSVFGSNTSTATPAAPTVGSSGATTGGTDANGTPTDPNASTNPTGPTFGGGGIIGVSPTSPKQSILVYKKKNHYNEWEFLYSPLSEQGGITTGATPIASPVGVGTPGVPIAPSGTAPTTPTDPTTPTTPQPQQ